MKDEERKIFLTEIHEIIHNQSSIREELINPSNDWVSWEPFHLTQEELEALRAVHFNSLSLSAIEKIVKESMMNAFFSAFSLLDGVSDPEVLESDGQWLGLTLQEKKEDDDEEFLHDALYETYGDWVEAKNRPNE